MHRMRATTKREPPDAIPGTRCTGRRRNGLKSRVRARSGAPVGRSVQSVHDKPRGPPATPLRCAPSARRRCAWCPRHARPGRRTGDDRAKRWYIESMSERYDPSDHRAQVAALLGGARRPSARDGTPGPPEDLRPRHVPVPVGRRPARRPPRGLHRDRHRRALQADARASTCCTRWAGTPSACPPSSTRSRPATHPRVTTQQNIDNVPPPDQDARLQLRLGPRGRHHRSRLLQVDAVDLPAAVRARPGVPGARCRSTGARRSAPCSPTRRSSTARASAAASRSCAAPLRQWMLRITAYAERLARGPRRRSTGRGHAQGDAAQLDRPQRGRRGRRSRVDGHADARSASSRRGPTRCSARPTWCSRPSTRWSTQLTTPAQRAAVDAYRRGGSAQERPRAHRRWPRTKTGVFTGAYAINPVNGEQIPIWIADYVLGELRHRRDHGRARRTTSATSSSRRSSACRSSRSSAPTARLHDALDARVHRRRRRGALAASLDGLPTRRGQARRSSRELEARGIGARRGQLQAARLAVLAPALLGRADPDLRIAADARTRTERRSAGRRDERAAGARCPSSTTSSRPATASRRSRATTTGSTSTSPTASGPHARDQHDAAVGGLVLVLPALPRPEERRRRVRSPRTRRTGCRSTSTSAAPSTRCCTCSTRGSGTRCCSTAAVVDARRAVPEAGQPGDDPGRGQREDVEVARQRRQPRRHRARATAPTRCASTRCSWARSRR